MQVLLGCTRDTSYLRRMRKLGWGRLFAAERPLPGPTEAWALDNGVFGAWKSGTEWDETAFSMSLFYAERSVGVGKIAPPLFAVLPDRVAEACSLGFSMDWLERRGQHFDLPWFLAVQNGMSEAAVDRVLEDERIAGLFLGGDDDFKLTAATWCKLAHARGKRFHFARASTLARLRSALEMRADSCDTTQPLWSVELFDRFEDAWLQMTSPAPRQTTLFGDLA